jgi:rod shape-determining protein MreD
MKLAFLVMTLGGSVAQATLISPFSVAGVPPDLPLIFTAFWALRSGPEAGCLAGFLAGLFQDVSGGGLIGVQAMTKSLVGFAMGLASARLAVANPLVQVPGLVVLTIVEGLLRFALLQLFHYPAHLSALMTDIILPQALYNGALGAACLVALAAIEALRPRFTWR